MSAVFCVATYLKRNDIVDSTWGPGFVLTAGAFYFRHPHSHWADLQQNPRAFLALTFLVLWAARLALHIGLRNFKKGSQEDVRYANWRREWGAAWIYRSFFQIFMLQGALLLVICMPLIWIVSSPPRSMNFLNLMGAALWCIGFGFEAIADGQLSQYKKQGTRGGILQTGLWKYSRHPNYFGEVVLWWGFFFLCLGLEQSWMCLASPLLITFLLLKVSGIPMLEREFENRPGWPEYKKKTSSFFPLPPQN
jgi:steroid 5-alpha reductase family enzyme